jgi:hypothetical protein
MPAFGYGALQPMAAGFAAGSYLAGTSGAGIDCSCPKGVIGGSVELSGKLPSQDSAEGSKCAKLFRKQIAGHDNEN